MFPQRWASFQGIAAALILACGACTPQTGVPTQAGSSQISEASTSGPWWRQSGDALLDDMVAQALTSMPPVCMPAPGGFRGRIQSALHHKAKQKRHAEEADRAAQRLRKAEAVAEAYLRLRAWQERLTARHAMMAPWADNAEIAHFRHEAGLVPGLDEDMAGVMVGLNATDEDAARNARDHALADLARLTGQDAGSLRARLEKTSPMPLNNAIAAKGDADELLAKAEAVLATARIAYRGGATTFAALYIAEVNVLAAREAQIMAAHAAALATIRQWSEKGMGEEAHCG